MRVEAHGEQVCCHHTSIADVSPGHGGGDPRLLQQLPRESGAGRVVIVGTGEPVYLHDKPTHWRSRRVHVPGECQAYCAALHLTMEYRRSIMRFNPPPSVVAAQIP